jgi:uncharacterized protein YndB with AHSA1/START domain
MEQPTVVTRDIELDAPAEEAWDLIGDASGWSEWMVDDADIVVEPGRHGTVRDDESTRSVRIREVVPGERVSFDWWTPGEDSAGSTVVLELVPSGPRTLLRVVETFPARPVPARASVIWDVRAACAWARCTALAAA